MITEEERIVFKAIEEADSIVFFGHKNPDGDCEIGRASCRERV